MSLPSHGIKKYLRIDGKKVSKYFKQKYNDESMSNVMIYNLSGRKYNYQHFNNRVKEFGFPNHGVPTMKHLWRIITDMKSQNCVTVVHCKAGKGRTGSIIASYLLINGECTTADESIKLFNSQRTKDEKAVQVPSQVRYTHYIEDLVRSEQENIAPEIFDHPQPLFLEKVVLRGCPTVFKKKKHKDFADSKFKYSVGLVIETFGEEQEFEMVFDDYLEGESEERTLELATNVTIRGDTKIKCYRREHSLLKFVRAAHKVNANRISAMKHMQTLPDLLLFRYNFHTSFTRSDKPIVLAPSDLDTPANLSMAEADLPSDYFIELHFSRKKMN